MAKNLSRRSIVFGLPVVLAAPAVFAQGLPGAVAMARDLDQLHAVVVSRNGSLLFAEAFDGPGLDRIANVKSVSKTILALLTGIAMDRGFLEGPEQRVLPLLGRAETGDARDELTIAHLLSMQSGLQSTSGPFYGEWIASNNWVDYALNQDLVDQPGGRFIYSTGSWHVLGAVLSKVTDRSLLDLVRSWIGNPLEIEFPAWVRDPQGRYLGGNEMAVTPRGLARLGDTVLAGGLHDGVQIVDPEWIETSWRPRARSPWSGDAYGFGWFLTEFAGQRAAYGRGYGGQLLIVVPDAQLSIAITSDPNRPARSAGYFGTLRMLADQLVKDFDS
ncbi:MAG: serine hydrolase [Pseudomonadota bacterium]